jgi:hypothetical protein
MIDGLLQNSLPFSQLPIMNLFGMNYIFIRELFGVSSRVLRDGFGNSRRTLEELSKKSRTKQESIPNKTGKIISIINLTICHECKVIYHVKKNPTLFFISIKFILSKQI